jgi:branched-chain amino acid transport system ATP-binding protein
MVEHNLGVVDRMCEPVVVMAEGKALAVGSMADHRASDAVVTAYLGRGRPA